MIQIQKLSIALLIIMSPFLADAKSIWIEALREIAGFPEDKSRICSNIDPAPSDLSENSYWSVAEKYMRKGKYCEAAEYYLKLRWEYPEFKKIERAWISAIDAYDMKGDYIEVINQANEFIKYMPESKLVELVHYKLLLAVDSMISWQEGKDSKWAMMAVGIHREQNSKNPFLLKLSTKDFLSRYPNSNLAPTVKNIQTHARVSLGNFTLRQGISELANNKYPSAIKSFQFILQQGRFLEAFEDAFYYTILTEGEFIGALETPRISDQQLQEMLGEGNNYSRLQVQQMLFGDMVDLSNTYKKEFPDGKFLEQIKKLIEKYEKNYSVKNEEPAELVQQEVKTP